MTGNPQKQIPTIVSKLCKDIFSAMYVANPNNPRHEMKMVSAANRAASIPVRFSALNFCAYSSSTNLYSKGYSGLYFLKIASAFFRLSAVELAPFNLKCITLNQFAFVPSMTIGLVG